MKKYLVLAISFPPEAGGIAEYIYNFSRSADAKITVLACTIKKLKHSEAAAYPFLKNIRVKRIPYLKFAPFLTKLWLLISVVRLERQEKFGLVICNHPLIGFAARFMKKVFQIDYILITHGWDVAKQGIYAGRFMKILQGAKLVVAISGFTKNSILEQAPGLENIHIIHPIVSDELIRREIDPEFKKKLGLEGKKILLTVSRLDANTGRKGHDMALLALAEVFQKHPDAVYAVVGNGPAKNKFMEFAEKLQISAHVKFFDYSRENIHNFYNICDVFIMPSRILRSGSVEGFGIVYLEAALFGKPSIGGRSGGVPEAVLDGETGILVDPLDPDAIAQAAVKLLDKPEYASALGEKAKQRALGEFSAEKTSGRIREVLALALKNKIRLSLPPGKVFAKMADKILQKEIYTWQVDIGADDIVVDIGANVGLFSCLAAIKTKNHIYAYEPFAENLKFIRRNIRNNGFFNIKVKEAAVGAVRGNAKLFLAGHSAGHLLFEHNINGLLKKYINVPCVMFEDVFLENGLERIDFLKMDCEGAEGMILQSTSKEYLKKIKKIAMEFHDNTSPLKHSEITGLLEGCGFSCALRWDGLSPTGYLYAQRRE